MAVPRRKKISGQKRYWEGVGLSVGLKESQIYPRAKWERERELVDHVWVESWSSVLQTGDGG